MREDFLREEVICGYKVTEEMKRVWAVQLDLLEKFMEVCDRHGLKYFAAYGTLLGAVRHKGFIPWDDDIDLAMPRKDFDKLKQIADEEFQHPYFFQTPENDPDHFMGGICRLRNSNTTHFDFIDLGHSCNLGCFIEIAALDGVHEDPVKQSRQIRKVKFYKSLLFAKVYGKDFYSCFDYSPLEWEFYRFLAAFASHHWLCKKFNEACSACRPEKTRYLAVFTQKNDNYEARFFAKDLFEQTAWLDFEHVKIPVPADYQRYISTVWDEGMELPPESARKPGHGAFLDPATPYKEYALPMFTDVFKDIDGKDILLFGAGMMFDYYMKKHGRKFRPKFVFDNDPKKWGTYRNGILVKNPKELPDLYKENSRIIIVNIYYREIADQLKSMGIHEYYVYLQGRTYSR